MKSRPAFSQVWELAKAIDCIAPLRHAAHLGARETNYWPPGPQATGTGPAQGRAQLAGVRTRNTLEAARKATRAAGGARASTQRRAEPGLELLPLEQSQDSNQEQERDWAH
ncbi:MAG: hypothetical protein R3B07_17645 [Polyangiaceae bacterium]